MTQQELQEFEKQWLNGVGVGYLWEKNKAAFLSGLHNQTATTTVAWKQQARANLDLNIGVNQIWYGSAANTIGLLNTSSIGRAALNTDGTSAVEDFWAEKATKDGGNNTIVTHYAHSLEFVDLSSRTILRLKSPDATALSELDINYGSGLVRLAEGKIPLSVIPDAILGQLTYGGSIDAYDNTTVSGVEFLVASMTDSAKAILAQRTGKTFGTKEVRLVATSSKPSDTSSVLYFNYADCKGIYFIWTAAALASHTGEPDYRIWPTGTGNPRYQSGDWLTTNEQEWKKIDNTDAVTGVKGVMQSAYQLGNVSLDALNVGALATYATQSGQQEVADKVQFDDSIWSLKGIAAGGMVNLSPTGGGGSGTTSAVRITADGVIYESVDGVVTIATPTISDQPDGTVSLGGVALPVKGLGTFAFISTLSLDDLTDAADIQAIEALTGTGILKRTGDGTWALRDAAGVRSDAGITGDLYTHNYSELVTAVSISGTNLSVTKGNGSAVTTAINAATLEGHAASYFATAEAVDVLASAIGQLSSQVEDNTTSLSLHDDRISDLESYFDGGSARDALTLEGHGASYFSTSARVDTIEGYFSNGILKPANLCTATTSDIGGVKIADPFTISNGVLGIGNGKITNAMLTSAGKFKIGTQNIELGQEYTQANWRSYLDLGTAATHAHDDYATAVGIDGVQLSVTKGDGTAVKTDINAATLGGVAKEGLFTLLENDNDQISATVGTTNKKLTVGYATTALDAKTELKQDQTITYRQTGGGTLTKPYSSGVIKRILGNTLVWNQLAPIKNTQTREGVTYTSNGNGSYTLSGTATATSEFYPINASAPVIRSGHKALFLLKGNSNATLVAYNENYNPINISASSIITVSTIEIQRLSIKVASGVQASGTIWVQLIDLTLMFGAGNEPSTVAEFEALYPNAYYEYNTGKLINNSAEGLETDRLGRNIWDEVWENGYISQSTGQNIEGTGKRSKNMIKVEPSTTYYAKTVGAGMRIFQYTSAGVFIDAQTTVINATFTTKSNTGYIRFQDGENSYNYNICINKSDASFNGTYEPYKKIVSPLHLNSFRVKDAQGNIVTINGLKKAGSVRDERVGNKYIKRVGSVDLGDLNWSYNSTYNFLQALYIQSAVTLAIKQKDGATFIAEKYGVDKGRMSTAAMENIGNMSIAHYNDSSPSASSIRIKNTSYTDPVTFKNAMSGVIAYYELETPIEYEIIDDFPTSYPIDVLGTERIVSDELVAPFIGDIQYGAKQNDFAWDIDHLANVLRGIKLSSGAFSDATVSTAANNGEWYELETSEYDKLFVRFVTSDTAYKLQIANAKTNPTLSREFEFGTLDQNAIDAICV